MPETYSSVTTELKDDHTLITVLADLDANMANEARVFFTNIIEHADRNVKLDLSLSKNIDSSGIGAIAFLYKRLKRLDLDLELVGLDEHAIKLIQSLHVDDIISIQLNKKS